MPDQPAEYSPGMFSRLSEPDHAPDQEPDARPTKTVRRSVAIMMTAGALVLGGFIGGAIGSAPAVEARHDAEQASEQNASLHRHVEDLKADGQDKDATITSLEAEVEELEHAPALLAAQEEARKAEEAAAKKEAEEEKAAEQAAAKKKAEEEKAAEEAAAKKAADEKKAAEQAAAKEEAAARAAAAEAERTFPGNGTFMVGEDIKPGRYASDAASSDFFENCYWARLSGTSGGFGDIITNHNSQGPTTVTISPTDVAFETNGCTMWERQD